MNDRERQAVTELLKRANRVTEHVFQNVPIGDANGLYKLGFQLRDAEKKVRELLEGK